MGRRCCPSQYQAVSNNLLDFPNCVATRRISEDIVMDSDGESACFNLAQDSSSEDEDTEDGKESNSQASESCVGQTENQMEVLEDIRALLDEDQELAAYTVKVSNCDSYFMCNRDNPLLKPPFNYPPYYPSLQR